MAFLDTTETSNIISLLLFLIIIIVKDAQVPLWTTLSKAGSWVLAVTLPLDRTLRNGRMPPKPPTEPPSFLLSMLFLPQKLPDWR
jgi:hypothetical protein